MQGVVRFLKTALLQIYCGNFQWKNFENRLLRFDRIMTMSLDIVFGPPVIAYYNCVTAVADLIITMLINGPENPYNCPTPMWGDPWTQLSLHPKANVDWISRFCTAHYGLSLYSIMGRDMPPKICPFVWGIQAAT